MKKTFILLASLIISLSCGFTVNSVAQLDLDSDKKAGSRNTFLKYKIASATDTGSLGRHVPIVRMEDVTTDLLEDMITSRRAPAILIVIPKDLTEVDYEEWEYVEKAFLSTTWHSSIVFVHESQEILDIMSRMETDPDWKNEKMLKAAKGPTPKALPITTVENLVGLLRGAGKGHSKMRNVLVLANYDSYSAVPYEGQGANDNASGVIALIHIAAMLSTLYKTKLASYNIYFALTGVDKFGFEGTRSFSEQFQSHFREELHLVLCLNTLGSSPDLPLYVHVSSPEGQMSNYPAETFASDERFTLIRHVIRIDQEELEWPHEPFALKTIPAVTISTKSGRESGNFPVGVLDTAQNLDLEGCKKNIKTITDFLGTYLYEEDSEEVEIPAISDEFIYQWLGELGSLPRMGPYLNQTIVDKLQKSIGEYLQQPAQKFSFKPKLPTFYSLVQNVEMELMTVKPFSFELTYLLAVCCYVGIFYYSHEMVIEKFLG